MSQISKDMRSRRAYYVEAWSDHMQTMEDGTAVGPTWRRVQFPQAPDGIGVPTQAFSISDSEYLSYHAAEALRHWLLVSPKHWFLKTRLVAVEVQQETVVTKVGTCAELEGRTIQMDLMPLPAPPSEGE